MVIRSKPFHRLALALPLLFTTQQKHSNAYGNSTLSFGVSAGSCWDSCCSSKKAKKENKRAAALLKEKNPRDDTATMHHDDDVVDDDGAAGVRRGTTRVVVDGEDDEVASDSDESTAEYFEDDDEGSDEDSSEYGSEISSEDDEDSNRHRTSRSSKKRRNRRSHQQHNSSKKPSSKATRNSRDGRHNNSPPTTDGTPNTKLWREAAALSALERSGPAGASALDYHKYLRELSGEGGGTAAEESKDETGAKVKSSGKTRPFENFLRFQATEFKHSNAWEIPCDLCEVVALFVLKPPVYV